MKKKRVACLDTRFGWGKAGKTAIIRSIPGTDVHFLPMSATHRLLKFGVFELNLDTEELRKFGIPIKLRPQPFRMLALLASHAGQVVAREEIKEQLWGEDTYVDFEHGMNKCVKQIRTALGDDVNKPVYIETVPRHGYRFLAPVVSKTVLAPPPRVKESSSGIPADLAEMIRARLAARKSAAHQAASGVATTGAVAADTAASNATSPDEPAVTTVPATPEPTVAAVRAPERDRRWIIIAGVIIVAVLALAVYWYFR
jgi:DNA-binding winged helix-turn-helix (wHTH) protein